MHGYRIRNQNALHFLTLTVVDWIDVFSRKLYKDMLIESLQFCQKEKGLIIYAYVIMSNHLHLIVKAKNGFLLSNILRDFKKFTAVRIIQSIKLNDKESRRRWMIPIFQDHGFYNSNNKFFQFWIQRNHPIELKSRAWIIQKLNYIHLNPVRAGLVDKVEHYVYSSALQYAGGKGVLEVKLLAL